MDTRRAVVLLVVASLAAAGLVFVAPAWAQQYQPPVIPAPPSDIPVIPLPPDEPLPLIPAPSAYPSRDLIERTTLCLNRLGPCDPEVLAFLSTYTERPGLRGPQGPAGRPPTREEIDRSVDTQLRSSLDRLQAEMRRNDAITRSAVREERRRVRNLEGDLWRLKVRLAPIDKDVTTLKRAFERGGVVDILVTKVERRDRWSWLLWFLLILALIIAIAALIGRETIVRRWETWRRRRPVPPTQPTATATATATTPAALATPAGPTEPRAGAPAQPATTPVSALPGSVVGTIEVKDTYSDRGTVLGTSSAKARILAPSPAAVRHEEAGFTYETEVANVTPNSPRRDNDWRKETDAEPGEQLNFRGRLVTTTDKPLSEIVLKREFVAPGWSIERVIQSWIRLPGEDRDYVFNVNGPADFDKPLDQLNPTLAGRTVRGEAWVKTDIIVGALPQPTAV